MIVVRAPMRISFAGGGTDLPDFYRRSTGRVISATIDKFVYIVINRTPLIDKVSARYSFSETVDHPSRLQHTRIRAALMDLGIERGIEIGSFASLPAKTGLGSSSSFTVALLKGLHAYQGKRIDKREVAEAASRIEIDILGEPIGKQDQYAAAFGGLNVFEFNSDESVNVKPVLLDFKTRIGLEDRLLLFFTGITRAASSVLSEQKSNIGDRFDTLREMSESVPEFARLISAGDFEGAGKMLHQGWLRKKSLASNVSNPVIDDLYSAGMAAGAWGGKVVGAGGGGCIVFLSPLDKKAAVREKVNRVAKEKNLAEFKEVPVKFIQSGAEVIFNDDQQTTLA
jgi:D-glycero-alpha-D-manno-heptose-7-phosphate kinase